MCYFFFFRLTIQNEATCESEEPGNRLTFTPSMVREKTPYQLLMQQLSCNKVPP